MWSSISHRLLCAVLTLMNSAMKELVVMSLLSMALTMFICCTLCYTATGQQLPALRTANFIALSSRNVVLVPSRFFAPFLEKEFAVQICQTHLNLHADAG